MNQELAEQNVNGAAVDSSISALPVSLNVDALPARPERGIEVPPDVLDKVRELYLVGRNLDALAVVETVAPLQAWEGVAARILAGRLAPHLGGGRLSNWHFLRAWRGNSGDIDATYYYLRTMLGRKGPYEVWRMLKKLGTPASAEAGVRADWLALEASVAGGLRDFATAEERMKRALELTPDRAWMWIERAMLWQAQDRMDDALQSARRAVELSPLYCPAVQITASLLGHMNRAPEAVALLEAAVGRSQSAPMVGHLAALVREQGDVERARALWERVAELSPLADREFKKYLAARRSDAAYDCGDFATVREQAKQAGKGFFEKIALHLSEDLAHKKRVELKVPFASQNVLQHELAKLRRRDRIFLANAPGRITILKS